MGIASDLADIKEVSDTIVANKVSKFCYTDTAYTNNDADGVTAYDVTNEQNIPVGTPSVMKVNETVVTKGWRARASSVTRMFMNHMLGRLSYNVNKLSDMFQSLLIDFNASLGTANGVATLDANGRIPYSQLPESAVELKGYWNASTNTPTLADGTGTNGDEYFVDTAGEQNLGSGTQYFKVGDRVVYTGGVWKNIDSGSVRTINTLSADAQGNVQIDMNNGNLWTKEWLTRVLGTRLGKYWKPCTGFPTNADFFIDSGLGSNSVIYVGGRYYVSAYTAPVSTVTAFHVYTSTDGYHWEICTFTDGQLNLARLINLTYKFGKYFLSSNQETDASDGGVWTSTNGIDFTRTLESVGTFVYINFISNDDILIAQFSSGNSDKWTEDGVNWSNVQDNLGNDLNLSSMMYVNNMWYGYTSSNLYTSPDGKVWTATPTVVSNLQGIQYLDGIWFAYYGTSTMWSEDFETWTACTGFSGQSINKQVIKYNGVFLATVSNKSTCWSYDGKSWTESAGLTGQNASEDLQLINGIIYGYFYKVSGSTYTYTFAYSLEGKIWRALSTGLASNTSLFIRYAHGLYLAMSTNHTRETPNLGNYMSVDGFNFVAIDPPAQNGSNSYGVYQFVNDKWFKAMWRSGDVKLCVSDVQTYLENEEELYLRH